MPRRRLQAARRAFGPEQPLAVPATSPAAPAGAGVRKKALLWEKQLLQKDGRGIWALGYGTNSASLQGYFSFH